MGITYSFQIGAQPLAQFLQGDLVFVHIQFTFQVVQFVLLALLLLDLITGRRSRVCRSARAERCRLNSMTLLSAKTRQI
jgi:hypothetical protein